jgi:anti-anti-sigma regulatory factor
MMNKVKSTKKRKPSPRAARVSAAAEKGDPVAAQADASPRAAAESARPVDAVAAASSDAKVHLESSLEIKDVEDAHRQLSATLARGTAVTVDVSRVGAVDTAGVQLLLAFQREAVNLGVSVAFCGESAAITHALTVLGLRDTIHMAAPRD